MPAITWYPKWKKKELKVRKRVPKKKPPKTSLFPYSEVTSGDGYQWTTDGNGNPIGSPTIISGDVRRTRTGSKTGDYTGPKPKPPPYPPLQHSLQVTRYEQKETLGVYVNGAKSGTRIGIQGGFGMMNNLHRLDNYFGKPQDLVSKSYVDTKLLLRVKDQSVNLAQALAERKQTTALFAETARRLATAAFMLRKGNWAEASRHLGYDLTRGQRRRLANNAVLWHKDQRTLLANSWLELQYGWKPLVDDVYGAAQAIAKANAEGGLILSASVKAKASRQFSRLKIPRINPRIYGVNEWVDGYRECKAAIRTKVWYRSRSSWTATLADVGITNPALLVWELLPYSFVVDWFLPVGNWLQTFDATVGQEFITGFTSSEYSYTDRMVNRHGYRFERNQTYTRTVLTKFPSSPLPSFKNPLGLTRMANALALLQTAFLRKIDTSRYTE